MNEIRAIWLIGIVAVGLLLVDDIVVNYQKAQIEIAKIQAGCKP